MSRHQRYEPVPQRPRDEVIILDSIHNASSYNYNSGIPNSVASSTHTPSIIAPSVPSSPPPSFHTHSSPGTPRPTPSTTTHGSHPSFAAETLWGVAPSTTGETEITIGTSNDALATIKSLKQRVEWLEESIGRLLLERENESAKPSSNSRDNCCVTFTDASPDLERALTSGRGSNCCVTFASNSADSKRERKQAKIGFFVGVCLVCLVLVAIMTSNRGSSIPKLQSEGMNGS